MNFKTFLADEDAVSPVIGVILMVAITVILAAVIGTFVLGLGDQVQNTAPQASFTFDFDSSVAAGTGTDLANGTTDSDDGELTITHDGGDKIESARLEARDSEGNGPATPWSGEVTAGSSVAIMVDGGDTVRVVWSGESGDNTATLGKWTGPGA